METGVTGFLLTNDCIHVSIPHHNHTDGLYLIFLFWLARISITLNVLSGVSSQSVFNFQFLSRRLLLLRFTFRTAWESGTDGWVNGWIRFDLNVMDTGIRRKKSSFFEGEEISILYERKTLEPNSPFPPFSFSLLAKVIPKRGRTGLSFSSGLLFGSSLLLPFLIRRRQSYSMVGLIHVLLSRKSDLNLKNSVCVCGVFL